MFDNGSRVRWQGYDTGTTSPPLLMPTETSVRALLANHHGYESRHILVHPGIWKRDIALTVSSELLGLQYTRSSRKPGLTRSDQPQATSQTDGNSPM